MKVLALTFMIALLFFTIADAMRFGTVQASMDASGIPKPSIPEFTVKLIDTSYYVSPTTTTDPYTGETVTQGGYYVQGDPLIEISIKNQPFTPFVDTATNKGISLFYQVRTKGHFSPDWSIVEYWIKEAPAYNPRNPIQSKTLPLNIPF